VELCLFRCSEILPSFPFLDDTSPNHVVEEGRDRGSRQQERLPTLAVERATAWTVGRR